MGQLVIFNAACRSLMRLVEHLGPNGVELKLSPVDLLVPQQRGHAISDREESYKRFLQPLDEAMRFLAWRAERAMPWPRRSSSSVPIYGSRRSSRTSPMAP